MNNIEIVNLEHTFKTLGKRKRLALLIYLLNGEASIHKLSTALRLPYKTAERNLINLQEAGFLNKRSKINRTFFSINKNAPADYAFLIKIINSRCKKHDVRQVAKSLLETAKKVDREFGALRKRWTYL